MVRCIRQLNSGEFRGQADLGASQRQIWAETRVVEAEGFSGVPWKKDVDNGRLSAIYKVLLQTGP